MQKNSNTLLPKMAAELAQSVYDINDGAAGQIRFELRYRKDLNVVSDSIVTGTTGGTFIRKETSIAIFAKGKGDYVCSSIFLPFAYHLLV